MQLSYAMAQFTLTILNLSFYTAIQLPSPNLHRNRLNFANDSTTCTQLYTWYFIYAYSL